MRNNNILTISKFLLLLAAFQLASLVSFSARAEFKLSPTWHLMKDVHLLASAARQLSRTAIKDLGDHPISLATKDFRKSVQVFTTAFKNRKIFTHTPDTDVIKQDFRVVKQGFDELRLSIRAHYKVDGMDRVRRKYDKLIYRYHRLRHSIDVHILEARRD